jgi:hypothetical protein
MKKLLLLLTLSFSVLMVKAQAINSIDTITASYIGVKNALVGSNPALAKSRAKDLLAVLSVPAKGMQLKEQKLLAALKADSRFISQASNLGHQRKHFAPLSKNMYALLSALGGNSATVYQQYCPMKKASWLSESEDIRNPYYGDEMLECGEVTATLKATK